MSDLNKLGLAEARDALRKGDVTSVELTESCLKAIDEADALNAFVHKRPKSLWTAPRQRMSGSRRAMRRPCVVCRSVSRTCSAQKACRRRRLRRFWKGSSRV